MATASQKRKIPFVRTHVLPALLIFLIPAFSVWFFRFAEQRTDAQVLQAVEQQVQNDQSLTPEKQTAALHFYRTVPVSHLMASSKPEAAEIQRAFESLSFRYATFRWMKRIAWTCLGTILATFVLVGISVAFSFRSYAGQFRALRIGWPLLRTSSAIQVVGQAVLAVALSYWVTAVFFEAYFVKLVIVAACMAVVAMASLLKAIFKKMDDTFRVEGESVSEQEAPALWRRIRDLAGSLDTAAPDQILLGVQPNFFVTEHAVTTETQVYQGRTLYLSLPILKVLGLDEADAVLTHELAHFSGQDTLWSRRISPLKAKFAIYLQMLGHGLSLVVAHFMHLFWKLYELSLRRLNRQREFRADSLGAELVSAEAMKRALIKITSYCEYRGETELAILKQRRLGEGLNLSRRLEEGFPAFLSSFTNRRESIEERVPHPFDTHPTLHNRLANLGFAAREALHDATLQPAAEYSWYRTIATAPALEEKMWNAQQQALQAYHEQQLAWRLRPDSEDEKSIVLRYFPHVLFKGRKGRDVTLDYDRLQVPKWPEPILFHNIRKATIKSSWGSKQLILVHQPPGGKRTKKIVLYPAKFKGEKADLLTAFKLYYSRHKTAEAQTAAPIPA